MKSILSIFLVFLAATLSAQNQTEVLNTVSENVCECLTSAEEGALESKPKVVLTNCINEGIDKNVDALIEIFGAGLLDGGPLTDFINTEITNRLSKNCDVYSKWSKPTGDAGYTKAQSAKIDELAIYACECSSQMRNAQPELSLQDILETCMQKSVMDNLSNLTNVFGEEISTDETLAYNIGIDIGNKLASECNVYLQNVAAQETEANIKTATGQIISTSKDDYVSIIVANENGEENTFYITKAFDGGVEFVDNLKTLKNDQTSITVFYIDEELYFKSEKSKRTVFRIETVDY